MSTSPVEPAPNKTLVLIHGEGLKPDADAYLKQWLEVLNLGLRRDFEDNVSLDGIDVRFIYYADLTAHLSAEAAYNPVLDLADRNNTLAALAGRNVKQFRRSHYEAMPGKSSLKEFMADVGAPLSSALGMGEKRIRHILPELIAYWADTEAIAGTVRERVKQVLRPALSAGSQIMVLAHGLGSVIAYDSFWELSHREVAANPNHRIHTWLTLGSPIADNYIRNRLLGGRANSSSDGNVSYPNLMINWLNVAAEDDYFCHDETVANDFSNMLKQKLVSRIRDIQIYNLSERFGRSDPHCSLGYLAHPRTSTILHDWLKAGRGT